IPSVFVIRISSFILSFHIPNRCEAHDWLADSGQRRRCDHFIDVFVSRAGFPAEARPRRAPDVDPARFQIPLELFAVPLFARLGAAHGATAPMRSAKEGFCARSCACDQMRGWLHAASQADRLTS